MSLSILIVLLLVCVPLTAKNLEELGDSLSVPTVAVIPNNAVYWSYPKLHLTGSTTISGAVGLGVTKQTSSRCYEHVLNAYKARGLFDGSIGQSNGIYYQMNGFKKPIPQGLFFTIQAGVMYYYDLKRFSTNWGFEGVQNDSVPRSGYAPILAIGFGFSEYVSKTGCIRFSLDAGCKMSPVNANITVVF